jgi:hypothetical protein
MNESSDNTDSDPVGGEGLSDTAQQIAGILREQRVLSEAQLSYAYRIQGKLGEQYSLVQVLKELDYLNKIKDSHKI